MISWVENNVGIKIHSQKMLKKELLAGLCSTVFLQLSQKQSPDYLGGSLENNFNFPQICSFNYLHIQTCVYFVY